MKVVATILVAVLKLALVVFATIVKAVFAGVLGSNTQQDDKRMTDTYYDNFTGDLTSYHDNSGRFTKV